MPIRFHSLAVGVGLCVLPWALQAQTTAAGQMLLVVGSVQVERQGQRLPLKRGDPVQAGDLIVVGSGSNAQVRFTDASLMALRAGTQFRIDAYRYSDNRAEARMDVTLVKGGLRAVTGWIGRQQPEAFATRTPTATVGIRGTTSPCATAAATAPPRKASPSPTAPMAPSTKAPSLPPMPPVAWTSPSTSISTWPTPTRCRAGSSPHPGCWTTALWTPAGRCPPASRRKRHFRPRRCASRAPPTCPRPKTAFSLTVCLVSGRHPTA